MTAASGDLVGVDAGVKEDLLENHRGEDLVAVNRKGHADPVVVAVDPVSPALADAGEHGGVREPGPGGPPVSAAASRSYHDVDLDHAHHPRRDEWLARRRAVLEVEADGVLDHGHGLLPGLALRVAPLELGAERGVAVFVLLDHDGHTVLGHGLTV